LEALLTKIMANELVHIGMEQQAEKVRASLWENLQGVPNENKLPRRGKDAGRRENLLSLICYREVSREKKFRFAKDRIIRHGFSYRCTPNTAEQHLFSQPYLYHVTTTE